MITKSNLQCNSNAGKKKEEKFLPLPNVPQLILKSENNSKKKKK